MIYNFFFIKLVKSQYRPKCKNNMRVCLCVRVFMHKCIGACMCIYELALMSAYECVFLQIIMYVGEKLLYGYLCVWVCVCVCVHVCICVYVCVPTYNACDEVF